MEMAIISLARSWLGELEQNHAKHHHHTYGSDVQGSAMINTIARFTYTKAFHQI